MGKHDQKRDSVEGLLNKGLPITRIADELNIPLGSMPYLLAKWGLLDSQVRQQGQHFTKEGRKSVSEKLKRRHAEGFMQHGETHWKYGKLKFRGEWVPKDEVKMTLLELQEQDPTIAEMAEECGVDPKTITNWLKRFGLQKGLRSQGRCSWWKGGHSKYRGPGWLTIRKEILERDGYKCRECGRTQDEARAMGHGLSVHHIVPFEQTQDNGHDNLITLCQSCHMIAENNLSNLQICVNIMQIQK